jgi:hypothetical protein
MSRAAPSSCRRPAGRISAIMEPSARWDIAIRATIMSNITSFILHCIRVCESAPMVDPTGLNIPKELRRRSALGPHAGSHAPFMPPSLVRGNVLE